MKSNTKEITGITCVALLVIIPLVLIFNALAVYILWNWVLAVFVTVPHLSLLKAGGIGFAIGVLVQLIRGK